MMNDRVESLEDVLYLHKPIGTIREMTSDGRWEANYAGKRVGIFGSRQDAMKAVYKALFEQSIKRISW